MEFSDFKFVSGWQGSFVLEIQDSGTRCSIISLLHNWESGNELTSGGGEHQVGDLVLIRHLHYLHRARVMKLDGDEVSVRLLDSDYNLLSISSAFVFKVDAQLFMVPPMLLPCQLEWLGGDTEHFRRLLTTSRNHDWKVVVLTPPPARQYTVKLISRRNPKIADDKDTDVVDLLKYLKLPEFSARKIGALKEHDSGVMLPARLTRDRTKTTDRVNLFLDSDAALLLDINLEAAYILNPRSPPGPVAANSLVVIQRRDEFYRAQVVEVREAGLLTVQLLDTDDEQLQVSWWECHSIYSEFLQAAKIVKLDFPEYVKNKDHFLESVKFVKITNNGASGSLTFRFFVQESEEYDRNRMYKQQRFPGIQQEKNDQNKKKQQSPLAVKQEFIQKVENPLDMFSVGSFPLIAQLDHHMLPQTPPKKSDENDRVRISKQQQAMFQEEFDENEEGDVQDVETFTEEYTSAKEDELDTETDSDNEDDLDTDPDSANEEKLDTEPDSGKVKPQLTEDKDESELFESAPSIGTTKIGRRWSRRGGCDSTLRRSSSPTPIETVKLKFGPAYNDNVEEKETGYITEEKEEDTDENAQEEEDRDEAGEERKKMFRVFFQPIKAKFSPEDLREWGEECFGGVNNAFSSEQGDRTVYVDFTKSEYLVKCVTARDKYFKGCRMNMIRSEEIEVPAVEYAEDFSGHIDVKEEHPTGFYELSHIDSFDRIYFMDNDKKFSSQIDSQIQKLGFEFGAPSPPVTLEPDMFYICHLKELGGRWYRVILTAYDQDTELAEVYSVDTGHNATLHRSQIKSLPTKLCAVPRQAFSVQLSGIRPAGGSTKWSNVAFKYLEKRLLAKDSRIKVMVQEKLDEGHYLAELEIHKPMKKSNPFEPKQDTVSTIQAYLKKKGVAL